LTFSTKKSLGQIYLQMRDSHNVELIVQELHAACKTETGADDNSGRAEWLLEMSALELQLCAITGDMARRKRAHARTKLLNHAIVDPTTMGIIHEDAGKMLMGEKLWKDAYEEFFNGFRRHSETANPRARACLKYVVLANMLSLSKINPFDSREAKAYQESPEIKAMINLRRAYDNKDARKFEAVLRDPKANLLGDAFLAEYVDDLLKQTRQEVLRDFVRPYRRVKLESIARELNVKSSDVEPILVRMVLDGRLDAKIDQGAGVLVVGDGSADGGAETSARFDALGKWADALAQMIE
jgi:COP9 signalosome complex subunit 2